MSVREHVIQASIKLVILISVITMVVACKRIDPSSGEVVSANSAAQTTKTFNPRVCPSIGRCVERVCYDGTSYLVTGSGGITPEVMPNTDGFVRSC